jgi:hypothetical protein
MTENSDSLEDSEDNIDLDNDALKNNDKNVEGSKRNPRWIPSAEIVEKLTNEYLAKNGIVVLI